MNKAIISVFVLAVTIVLSYVFYTQTVAHYPEFGEFFNLLFLGLTAFFGGVGVFISGLLLGQSVQESR